MQYEKEKTNPESTRKYLVQQVEEQSDLCDVVVKLGYWEKKFHRCVLVVSPFFERALKNNFLEKQTGTIEMTIGTPLTLETAILFLYGERPQFTEENIGNMLELAEFLLIPKLKLTCIFWLHRIAVTEENCMKLLQLSSLYGFQLQTCVDYLLGHLLEMFENEQTVHLTKDSVQELLSDEKLSYVPVDDKVRFLMRWVNFKPTKRNMYLTELFKMIDFNEVSIPIMDELRDNEFLSKDLEAEMANIEEETRNTYVRNVLVMVKDVNVGTLWCLDFDRAKWFRLDIRQYEEYVMSRAISYGIRKDNSEIYFTDTRSTGNTVLSFDLEADTCNCYTLVQSDAENDPQYFKNVFVMGDLCVASKDVRVKNVKQELDTDSQPSHLWENMVLVTIMVEEYRRALFPEASTLYAGYKIDGHFEMSPLISIKDDISNICVNKTLTVAISLRKVVKFFDLTNYKLETIEVEKDHNDTVVQNNDGFIIYNTERCICLMRVTEPSYSSKFITKEIVFPKEYIYNKRYVFCDNSWYRYSCQKFNKEYVFESASHKDVMSRGSFEGVVWKRLPLPKEESECYFDTLKGPMFKVSLPKSKLRCHIECPHCKLKTEDECIIYTEEAHFDYDFNDYIYRRSSDDDNIFSVL